MSYDPERESKTEFLSAWNSTDQSLPYSVYSPYQYAGFNFNLDSMGDGGGSIDSNIFTPPDSLYAYFTGDIRINTYTGSPVIYGDIHAIQFAQNDADDSAGGSRQFNNRSDDQCYSIASSANLQIGYALRISGTTIAPFVRVLGVMIEES